MTPPLNRLSAEFVSLITLIIYHRLLQTLTMTSAVTMEEEVVLLRKRVADLESENARLVQQLAHARAAAMPPLRLSKMVGSMGEPDRRVGTRSANTSPVRAIRPQSAGAATTHEGGALTGVPAGNSSLARQGSTLIRARSMGSEMQLAEGQTLCEMWCVELRGS